MSKISDNGLEVSKKLDLQKRPFSGLGTVSIFVSASFMQSSLVVIELQSEKCHSGLPGPTLHHHVL